jgi:hypothetical protein
MAQVIDSYHEGRDLGALRKYVKSMMLLNKDQLMEKRDEFLAQMSDEDKAMDIIQQMRVSNHTFSVLLS